MALIIEDGTGVASADSYATRAGYITFASDYYGETVADEDASDSPLRRAAAYLDGLRWKGSRTLGRSQELAWPRADMVDCDGNSIDDDAIPSELILAQYELARAEDASPGVLSPQGSLRDSVVNKEKVDVIEVGYDTSRLAPGLEAAQVIVDAAIRRIRCYLVNGGKPGARITDARVV